MEVTDRTEGRNAAAAGALFAGAGAGSRTEASETAKNRNKRKSVGLDNVRTRLAIQSGGTLDMESTGTGKKVTIMLPVPQVLNKL
jgi:signal transduction histidine kinase